MNDQTARSNARCSIVRELAAPWRPVREQQLL